MVKRNNRHARETLMRYFSHVGEPINQIDDTIEAMMERYSSELRDDTFLLMLYVNPIRIKMIGMGARNVFGGRMITYEDWFELIHPSFSSLYILFADAAYALVDQYKEQVNDIEQQISYSIEVPINIGSQEEPTYWYIKQTSYPIQFDAEGNMVSHLNVNTLTREFEDYYPMRPYVFFNKKKHEEISQTLLENAKKNVLELFSQRLAMRLLETLITYWQLYSDHKEKGDKYPSAAMVAAKLKVKPSTVRDYNKKIKKAGQELFPLPETFRDAVAIVEFLYKLLGRLDTAEN